MALQLIIRRGDIIVIKEPQSLGRNYKEIQKELQQFKIRDIKLLILNISMHVIQDKLLDTMLQDNTIDNIYIILQ